MMRHPQRRGGRPVTTFRHKPTKADDMARAKGLILARLSRGLPCEPSMLTHYGLKPVEAERLIDELRSNMDRLF